MHKKLRTKHQYRLQQLLRELRMEAGLRQIDVSKRIREPQSFVSKYENGERRLDVIELREICAVFGVSLVEFAERLEALLVG